MLHIARQTLYVQGQGVIEEGQEFDLDLPEGVEAPPKHVAIPKQGKKGKRNKAEVEAEIAADQEEIADGDVL